MRLNQTSGTMKNYSTLLIYQRLSLIFLYHIAQQRVQLTSNREKGPKWDR